MSAPHPLDPLTPDEIRAAAASVRLAHPELPEARFALLTLQEPPKDLVRSFRSGHSHERRAFAVVLDRAGGGTYEAAVDLSAGTVVSWNQVHGVQPPILMEEIVAVDGIVKSSDEVRRALANRGVTDLGRVQVDPWSSGTTPVEGVDSAGRLLRATLYLREFPEDNGYAHPIENLVVVVDMNGREVVKVVDDGAVPIPPEHGNYDSDTIGKLRQDLRPLEISQPEGISFTLDGHSIHWQCWSLHVSLHAVEGLVLHDVRYRDGDRDRSILYRAAISEMVVPYGDPAPTFHFKNAFDEGEYNLGKTVNPLELGCDCLGEIRYLDAVLADEGGEPMTVPNAICIHEEDHGILWKHWDFRYREQAEVRRSRRLVISCIYTLGNYEYGMYWYFYLDGTIQFEVKLTGILQTKAVLDGEATKYGTIVAPQLEAPNHQHLFNMRLDMDVDGPENTVFEVDTVPLAPGPDNPYGSAFVGRATPIKKESESGRFADPLKARYWKVLNPNVTNRLGQPVGYKLIPHEGPVLLAGPESDLAPRAVFAQRHLWVTRYDPSEKHAAGDYVNQHPGGDGLPRWIRQDRGLEGEDIVLWHTFGTSHLPRPEEWPVMPVESVGFTLKPVGFFDRNPALDVPPPPGHCFVQTDAGED